MTINFIWESSARKNYMRYKYPEVSISGTRESEVNGKLMFRTS